MQIRIISRKTRDVNWRDCLLCVVYKRRIDLASVDVESDLQPFFLLIRIYSDFALNKVVSYPLHAHAQTCLRCCLALLHAYPVSVDDPGVTFQYGKIVPKNISKLIDVFSVAFAHKTFAMPF